MKHTVRHVREETHSDCGWRILQAEGLYAQESEKIVLAVPPSLLSDWSRGKLLFSTSFSTIMMCSESDHGLSSMKPSAETNPSSS